MKGHATLPSLLLLSLSFLFPSRHLTLPTHPFPLPSSFQDLNLPPVTTKRPQLRLRVWGSTDPVPQVQQVEPGRKTFFSVSRTKIYACCWYIFYKLYTRHTE